MALLISLGAVEFDDYFYNCINVSNDVKYLLDNRQWQKDDC